MESASPVKQLAMMARASPEPESAPTREAHGMETYRADETAYYEELVEDGGRPVCHIRYLNMISDNPARFRAAISLWNREEADWRIFGTQLRRWKEFRMWQRDNRGIVDMDAEFAAHLDARKRKWRRFGLANETTLDRLASFVDREDWNSRRIRRLEEVRELRITDFALYVAAVKKRLAGHNFTQSFNLEQNPRHQDVLTTWIEYLNFEYWWADKFEAWNQPNVPAHDKAWKALEDAGLIQPDETEDDIWSVSQGMQRMLQLDAARRLAKDAKAYLEQVERDAPDPEAPQSTSSRRAKLLEAAQTKHKEAHTSLLLLEARRKAFDRFQEAFRDYWDNKKTTDRHKARAAWVQDQVPIIEAEIQNANPTKTTGQKRALQKPESPKPKRRNSDLAHDRAQKDASSSPQSKRVSQTKEGDATHLRRSARVRGIPPPPVPAPLTTRPAKKKTAGTTKTGTKK